MRQQLREGKSGSVHVVTFDDVAETVGFVRDLRSKGRADYMAGRLCPPGMEKVWFGRKDIRTLDDAVRVAAEVWQAGISRLVACREKLTGVQVPEPRSFVRRNAWREQDGDFCLDRFVDGRECFRSPVRRRENRNQFVTLLADVTGNCDESEATMCWRAVASIIIAELLERANYSVELHYYHCSRGAYKSGRSQLAAICLKEGNQPLDLPDLINALSTWFFRTIGFAVIDAVESERVVTNLGRAQVISPEMVGWITPDPAAFVIDRVHDLKTCVDFVRSTVEAINSDE